MRKWGMCVIDLRKILLSFSLFYNILLLRHKEGEHSLEGQFIQAAFLEVFLEAKAGESG